MKKCAGDLAVTKKYISGNNQNLENKLPLRIILLIYTYVNHLSW